MYHNILQYTILYYTILYLCGNSLKSKVVWLQAAACLLLAEEAFVTVALRGIKGSQVILKAQGTRQLPCALESLRAAWLLAGLAAHCFPPSEPLHPP